MNTSRTTSQTPDTVDQHRVPTLTERARVFFVDLFFGATPLIVPRIFLNPSIEDKYSVLPVSVSIAILFIICFFYIKNKASIGHRIYGMGIVPLYQNKGMRLGLFLRLIPYLLLFISLNVAQYHSTALISKGYNGIFIIFILVNIFTLWRAKSLNLLDKLTSTRVYKDEFNGIRATPKTSGSTTEGAKREGAKREGQKGSIHTV